MRTIAHISDLHFGTESEPLVEAAAQAIRGVAPDVIAVSGDLTQRASVREFRAAAAFLERLTGRKIVVPGNHDVPLYNLFLRLLFPLARFRREIEVAAFPMAVDDELAVIGAASARSLTISGGRLSGKVVAEIKGLLVRAPAGAVRALVVHHPVDPAGRRGYGGSLGKHVAVPELGSLGIDILLSGHLHRPSSDVATVERTSDGRTVVMIAAGTATSRRTRHDEVNSFNVVRVEAQRIEVDRYDWNPSTGAFRQGGVKRFEREPRGWKVLL